MDDEKDQIFLKAISRNENKYLRRFPHFLTHFESQMIVRSDRLSPIKKKSPMEIETGNFCEKI